MSIFQILAWMEINMLFALLLRMQIFVCTYYSETFCPDVWLLATDALTNLVAPQYQNDESLQLPNCSEPQKQIDFLNLDDNCCTNGGIVIPGIDFI